MKSEGYRWLLRHFGKPVADPVRLHVLAKRFLCTTDPNYEKRLSPTSHKSFLDQGGCMDKAELEAFKSEEYWREAIQLREWDDVAKDALRKTPPIEQFASHLEASLRMHKRMSET